MSTSISSLFVRSSALEVRNDVCSVFGVGDAGEGHGVARGETRRVLQPLVEVTVGPLDGGLGGEGAGVGEALAGRDVLAGETA